MLLFFTTTLILLIYSYFIFLTTSVFYLSSKCWEEIKQIITVQSPPSPPFTFFEYWLSPSKKQADPEIKINTCTLNCDVEIRNMKILMASTIVIFIVLIILLSFKKTVQEKIEKVVENKWKKREI